MPSADDRWGAGSHDAKTRSEERARKNGGPTRRSGLDVRMVRTYAGTRETRALCPLRIGPYSLLCVGIGFFTSVISVCICRGIGQSRWHVSRPQMARAKWSHWDIIIITCSLLGFDICGTYVSLTWSPRRNVKRCRKLKETRIPRTFF